MAIRSLKTPKGTINLEALSQGLYDHRLVPTGASTQTYFTEQGGRSRLFTNIYANGALPIPKRFKMTAVQIVPVNGTPAADLASLYNNAFLTLTVGEKPYLDGPLALLVPRGLELVRDTVANVHQTRDVYQPTIRLDEPVHIAPQQAFRITLETAPTHVSSAPVGLYILLKGTLFREP